MQQQREQVEAQPTQSGSARCRIVQNVRRRPSSPCVSLESTSTSHAAAGHRNVLSQGPCVIAQSSISSPYLANKHSQLAMHQLVAKTTTTVFPLASRSFVDRLMLSAMKTPPLLYALLACFGSHHARRMTSPTSTSESERSTTLMFTNNAISGLRAALAREGATTKTFKAETLMTAMALCTNDVCNGNLDVFRMHLKAIRQMLLSFISSLPSKNDGGTAIEDSVLNVYLMKWFAALDVSASLSLFTPYQRGDDDNQQKFADSYDGNTTSGYWNKYKLFNLSEEIVVDDICGYSLNLVPIFSQIGNMARAQYDNLPRNEDEDAHSQEEESQSGSVSRHSPDLISQAQLLENQLEALPSPQISTRGIWTSQQHQLVEELRDTHPAFVHTALLHLHRRVQLLPKSHPKVRNDVTNILRVVQNVRPFSPANVLLIWPLFSAGCETDSAEERAIVDERMSIMQSLGMGNFTRGREALTRFWGSGTALRWDVYLARSGIDLVLF
jgi:Fungal specific transcription factor domain